MTDSKIALITGAGSGVGRAAALALSQHGYTIVLAGRRPEPLDAVAKELAGKSLAVPTDVSDPDSVDALFAKISSTYGRLDLLFNNAGVNAPAKPLEELSFAQWKSVIDINVTGVFLCTQGAVKIMRDQQPRGGRIINNGSISAHVPRLNSAAYTASKHAVTGLTRSTSLEGRNHDIACGQIDIGNAATDMAAGMKTGMLQANGSVATEPTIDPQHVADALVYMAGLPLDVNVQFITVMATTMPFIGRG